MEIGGGSLPAVRVELLPFALNRYGISTEDVRAAIQASNANRPKGAIEGDGRRLQIYTQTPALARAPTTRRWSSPGATARRCACGDVAEVIDGVENTRTLGLFNGEPAVIVLVTRQPGANVIETVDGVRALLPELQAQLPARRRAARRLRPHQLDPRLAARDRAHAADLDRAGGAGRQRCSCAACARPSSRRWRRSSSLLGTFGVMYLLGFSLNNLSLMALTVATGFVVDDAIVVLENTSRHIEAGMDRMQAALLGAREVGFTVLSISLSLVAVFIPLLFMGGPGRAAVPRVRGDAVGGGADLAGHLADHHADDVRLAAAARRRSERKPPGGSRAGPSAASPGCCAATRRSLDWALAQHGLVLLILRRGDRPERLPVHRRAQGLLPAAGHRPAQRRPARRPEHLVPGDAATSCASSSTSSARDPAVDTVVGFTGGGRAGGGFMFVNLKPPSAAHRAAARR